MQALIWKGIKGAIYALLAVVLTVIAGALSTSLGFKPEGMMSQTVWLYVIVPALTGIIRFIKEYVASLQTKK